MLYASDDKEKPIPFLEFAAKNSEVEKEVLFYLARAYHLNYRFDDAIKVYNDYKRVASGAKAEKLMVERQIEMCKNGKKLLRNITDLVVIDKKEMSRNEFYRSYDISDIGGKLLVKPDEPAFKTPVDKKKKENSIIYLATNNNQVFFSSYGENTERGKDIFVIRKLPNGEWSKAQTLGYPVNTEYDEDFPFLHPNGKVLYFCSKGHTSMGGYDIFKTTLNEETNTWNKPVNMDFPINTPDDDILYVTNEDEKEAFFSSARNSVTGKTAVFHINVERKPIDVAIIKGALVATKEGQALDARITVKDLGDNSILGIYNAKETGGYLINLPNGGKFMFTVEVAGMPTQSEMVVLPTQYEFKPLKQEISYEAGTDKLIVKNLFDEEVDDASYMLAMKLIKEKSKLEASSAAEIAEAKNNTAATAQTTTETNTASTEQDGTANSKTTPTNLSNEEIIKIAYSDAKDVETEAKEFKEQADIALTIANQKNEIAQNKLKEADQLKSDANSMTDKAKKQATLDEANAAYKEAEELNQETVAAFNLAKRLELTSGAKQKEADLSLSYAKNIETAVKSKNATEALAKLEEQQKQLDALNAENTASSNIVNSIKIDAENKKRDLDKATQELADVKQEIIDNETLIATTQADIEKTKNEQIKADLQNQIEGLKADNELSKKDIVNYEEKVNKLQKEYNGILNEVALVSNVVNQSKTTSNESAAATVAAIDKTKLEQQVNSIKSSPPVSTEVAAVKTNNTVTPENTNTTTEVAVTTSEVKSTNTPETTTTTETPAVAKEDYNAKFNEQLETIESISNPADRENKKAEIYSNWVTAMNQEIAELKKEQKATTDKEQKKTIAATITGLEKDLKTKQQTAKETLASAKKLEKEQGLAANTTTTENTSNPTTENTSTEAANVTESATAASTNKSNQEYAEELFAAQNMSNELEREKAKAAVLNNWATAINAEMEKKKADMKASTDPEMKALLAQKIVDLKKQSEEKQTQANESTAKVDALQGNATIANKTSETSPTTTEVATNNKTTETSPTTTEVATNNKTTETSPTTTEVATNNKTTETTPTTTEVAATNTTETNPTKEEDDVIPVVAQKKQVGYTAPQAAAESTKADAATKQAEQLTQQATDLKQQAAEASSPTVKDELYAQAETLEKQSQDKKMEAAAYTATANKVEYLNNTNQLQQLEAATGKNNADDLMMADMMKDEAVIYFNKAQKNREEAASANQYYAKETLTEEAAKNEQIAIDKQQKATAIYKKYNPNFVASNTAPVNTTTENKWVTTTQPVNNKTTETATTSPVVANATENTTTNTQPENTTAVTTQNKTPETTTTTNTTAQNTETTPVVENATSTEVAATTTPETTTTTAATNPVVENTTTPVTTEAATNNTATTNNTAATTSPIVLEPIEKFERKATPVYTASKPIPVNEKLPEGLIFKVQIGAFKNPIPQDLFKGMTPITGETTPQGYTRYTAGLFTKLVTAEKVKQEIREMGYKDAFVVAFYNGKRISMKEVATLLGEQRTAAGNDFVAGAATSTDQLAINNQTGAATTNSTATTSTNNTTPVATSTQQIAVSENVANVTGLFYTVQVGVFSQPVSVNKLNIQPLYTEKAPNGNIRYNTGVYNNVARAVEAKNIVIGAGIKDAFVTAYIDGKRVSLSEAQQMVAAQGNGVFSTAPTMNQLPTVGGRVSTSVTSQPAVTSPTVVTTPVVVPVPTPVVNTPEPTQPVVTQPTATTTTAGIPVAGETIEPLNMNNVPASVTDEKGVVFKIQIGAFNEEVPLAIANKFLRIARMGVKNYEDERGLTVYTVGAYSNYEDANKAKAAVVSQGITDAFIVAYSDGKKITIDEAKQLLNK
ncbi:MAG: PD40 domain-containing protein [Bacteroidetes bacterium]|nr:PD40 domain-containing protein [Bacteroidota bacterium]